MSAPEVTLTALHPIPDDSHLPGNWAAQEIILARLSYYTDARGRLNFRFSEISYYNITSIATFLDGLKNGTLPQPLPPATSRQRKHSLEIPVRTWCYVVVTFEPGLPMRFRSGGPAITAKEDYDYDNCGLKHYKSDLTALPTVPREDCAIAYFCVVDRDQDEHHYFNFHLELEQDGNRGWLEICLDPDVPDDGGTIPPLFPPAEPGEPAAQPAEPVEPSATLRGAPTGGWRKFTRGRAN